MPHHAPAPPPPPPAPTPAAPRPHSTPALPPPPPPSTLHATTAVPTRPPDDSLTVPADASQSVFTLVAITIPAVLAAAAHFINHSAGRRR
ncbi:hypothetical protein ACIGXM_12505 [Kitasatospora sp. NPDC052896]|uniref:hypothetical protein n=1 Tax=Kitasatospora sp. NPDC052896 TaxID=3364061 RepID=UPI0037CA14CB